MSVIVVGLPAVEAPQLPPLRTVDAKQLYCLQKSPLVLPVEGAPLVFSSDIAHNFVLRIKGESGSKQDLLARPDAASGGFVVDTHAADPAKLDAEVTATLRGSWGFEEFDGPNFHLRTSRSAHWSIPAADESALVVGREDVMHLQGPGAVCVDDIGIQDAQGHDIRTTWKLAKPEELEIKVALKDQSAGSMKLKVHQFALGRPDEMSVQAYSEAAHLEGFVINAGDPRGTLKGSRLDEVERLELKGARFVPAKLTRANERDELGLAASESNPPALQPKERVVAHVALKDGRVLELPTTVEEPRPKVTLVSKNIRPGPMPTAISLGSKDELPLDGHISFLLKTEIPNRFPHSEKIEITTVDEAFSVLLSFADGGLVLRDSEDLVATLEPTKAFGPSAFGPLQFRPIDPEGGKGDWQPLATLVRLPILKEIRCSASPDKPCQLSGTNLYLIDSVASDPQFTHTAPVPTDFLDATLGVPHPGESGLYIKLRDDPSAVSSATLPITPEE
jgi:hypothetical protein